MDLVFHDDIVFTLTEFSDQYDLRANCDFAPVGAIQCQNYFPLNTGDLDNLGL